MSDNRVIHGRVTGAGHEFAYGVPNPYVQTVCVECGAFILDGMEQAHTDFHDVLLDIIQTIRGQQEGK